MADAALRKMSVEEFIEWNSGDDRRYQLIDGVPVMMAPPDAPHRLLAGELARVIGNALAHRRPCAVQLEAGLVSRSRARRFWVADIAVTCEPAVRGQPEIPAPILIVEVLSPTTEEEDRKDKLPDYRLIESVQEIVLIDPNRVYCEVHRRVAEGSWPTDLLVRPDARFVLNSVGLDLELGALYANLPGAQEKTG